jgi:hypothetical protein
VIPKERDINQRDIVAQIGVLQRHIDQFLRAIGNETFALALALRRRNEKMSPIDTLVSTEHLQKT